MTADRSRGKDRRRQGRRAGAKVQVHVLIRGRIGDGWFDVDRVVKLRRGTTVGQLVEAGARHGLPLAEVLSLSPELAERLMINGERCPLQTCRDRTLDDGDALYLLAPLVSG